MWSPSSQPLATSDTSAVTSRSTKSPTFRSSRWPSRIEHGRFDVGAESSLGRLDPAGTLDVPTITLDELVTGGSVPSPHVLKLDIEGAESDALVGAAAILREARPDIFLATHGSMGHDSCLSILSSSGYSVEALEQRDPTFSDELIARPSPVERR
jgi:FkbM family methyltransferase